MKEEHSEQSEESVTEKEGLTTPKHPLEAGERQADENKGCKGYGHLIVVPIPLETKMQPLIELGRSLACPKDGLVVALLLAVGEPEEHAYRLHQIEPIIESMKKDGQLVGMKL